MISCFLALKIICRCAEKTRPSSKRRIDYKSRNVLRFMDYLRITETKNRGNSIIELTNGYRIVWVGINKEKFATAGVAV